MSLRSDQIVSIIGQWFATAGQPRVITPGIWQEIQAEADRQVQAIEHLAATAPELDLGQE